MPAFLIIGAGFSGAVLARQLVEALPDSSCEVWDERPHIAGNCHTERDPETGVMLHKYGPHIFNTDNEKVWKFVKQHGDFRPFTNRVKAHTSRGIFSLPINLLTINQFFGRTMSPSEAKAFIATLGDSTIVEPQNFEEQALKMLGRDLYETFFKGYTIKQWGCDPKELPASILKRLPIRFNYDDNYYNKRFQGIPAEGYTEVIRSILNHPRITILLNKTFSVSAFQHFSFSEFSHVFYTGPLDAFFDHCYGRLGYRTVTFERIDTDEEDYQGNAVINYPDLSVPWTRIHEHKHFAPWESHDKTVAFREYSQETGPDDIPYYPKRLAADKALLAKYRQLAEQFVGNKQANQNPKSAIQNFPPVSFLGRLATYRYMDMETVIGEALDFADKFVHAFKANEPHPVFPNSEENS
jgi:UDP-galactopyranose mutase